MKKSLYSTTALAAAGMLSLGASDAFAQAAAPAAPEKLKIAIGGFMTQLVGYTDQSGSYERGASQTGGRNGYKNFDIKNDAEIHFSGSVKLDNGMTVSVMVQLEGDDGNSNNGTGLDESFMTIAGEFGSVKIGQTDFSGGGISAGAPWTGARNPSNSDVAEFSIKPSANKISTTLGDNGFGGGDTNKIGYTTPAIAGFRMAFDYVPDNTTGNTNGTNAQPLRSKTEVRAVTLGWAGTVDDFGIKANVAYVNNEGTEVTDDIVQVGGGLELKYADWTLGGGYKETQAKNKAGARVTTSNPESWVAAVGVKYAPANFEVGLYYNRVEFENTGSISADDTNNRWLIGAKYNIGPGVDLVGTIVKDSYQSETNNPNAENSPLSVLGGIAVTF